MFCFKCDVRICKTNCVKKAEGQVNKFKNIVKLFSFQEGDRCTSLTSLYSQALFCPSLPHSPLSKSRK